MTIKIQNQSETDLNVQSASALHNQTTQQLRLWDDPYQYYYDRFHDNRENEVDLDNPTGININVVEVKKILKEQFVEAKSNRNEWTYEGMKKDPAFMVDPVNNYYKKVLMAAGIDFSSLSKEEELELISTIDPVTWGERYLLQRHGGWKARISNYGFPYQAQMIRCRSKRINARAGRRIGKTVSLVVRILHKAFTWQSDGKKPNYKIVIFTPNQAQIDLIFKMIETFIDNNPVLTNQIVPSSQGIKIPARKNPFYGLEFKNGVTISGFVSGSSAIRGQAADFLVMDEASFLTKDDTDAVAALLLENKNVEMWVSSTPKGLRDWFYDRAFDPDYVSFHFPTDRFHPSWSPRMEAEFRKQLTSSGYKFEVLADFAADGESVFQAPFVQAARRPYKHEDCKIDPGCIYGLGCDWNSAKNGTQIKVVEYNPTTQRYRIVDSMSIHIEGWVQTTAVKAIRDANRKWQCSFIYVDDGYGAMQIEALHEMGMLASPTSPDRTLVKARGINFSSAIEVFDPHYNQKVKKPAKPFMVNNAVRVFENLLIDIPEDGEMLIKQMQGYSLDGVSPNNTPKYKADATHGDHELDALMLALLGFTLEYGSLANPVFAQGARVVNHIYGHGSGANILDPAMAERDASLKRDKARERQEFIDANGVDPNALFQPMSIHNSGAKPRGHHTAGMNTIFGGRSRQQIIKRNNSRRFL